MQVAWLLFVPHTVVCGKTTTKKQIGGGMAKQQQTDWLKTNKQIGGWLHGRGKRMKVGRKVLTSSYEINI